MQIAFWIVAALTALMSLAAGFTKVSKPTEALVGMGMQWTESYSNVQVKTIGALEVVAAVGIIVPALTGIAPVLSPIAAVCLFIVMVGAVVVHVRRKESSTPAIVLGLLAAATAVLGFVTLLG